MSANIHVNGICSIVNKNTYTLRELNECLTGLVGCSFSYVFANEIKYIHVVKTEARSQDKQDTREYVLP